MVHLKYDAFFKSTAKSKVKPKGLENFEQSFENAKQGNPEVEKHMRKAVDDMNPLRVLNLLRRITPTDCELLGLNPEEGRPEMFIWQYVPAPPVCIRPSVAQESATNEDDLTNKLGDIIDINSIIRAGLRNGQPIQNIMEQWDYMQLQIAVYINSDVPGLKAQGFERSIRGFCQRLKGKGGRFRQNLSGKRVDFSGRTVIGPDPNLSIEEVAVPERVAKNLTFPERVSQYNLEKMKRLVENGPLVYPGANYIIKQDGRRNVLAIWAGTGTKREDAKPEKLKQQANNLRIGDIVERHLEDGDIVLFNRQPSLHKLSILCHRAKIRPWRTFRLNECVCNPYNADFDGDEMNLHVPQTEEARAEALELMGVKHNIATPKNGTPIIAAIQDFITGAYLVSHKDTFFDRKGFMQACGFMFNADSVIDPETGERLPIEIPPPAIYKPERLWTGKQVFNVLMRPNKKLPVLVNLEGACKQYKKNPNHPRPDLSEEDAWLVIRNSEVMCGVMDKATVGDGKKTSVFYVLMRDFGPDYAVQAMNRLAKLSARWLTNRGFSIGISDVTPGVRLVAEKQKLITKAYAQCDEIIQQYKDGTLSRDAGCDEEHTMENRIGGILSGVRQQAGEECFRELSRWNSAVLMAQCGSKGSNINVSQMVASVGQQMINNARVADGFQDRTLPHFPKAARQPGSKGFVSNSFYSGLTPTEFIFHAMSGREGLVDTAVKTAETGYMSRRLMKSLEDLSAQYDGTVRNSGAGIVQFQYGDDNLDPVDMEGKAVPVDFERTFEHAIVSTWEPGVDKENIPPHEVADLVEKRLRPERRALKRVPLMASNSKAKELDNAIRKAAENAYEKRAAEEGGSFYDGQRSKPQKRSRRDVSEELDKPRKSRRRHAIEDSDDEITGNDSIAENKCLEDMTKEELEALPTNVFFDMLGFNDKSDDNLDDKESKRDFLDNVENFLKSKANSLIKKQHSNPTRTYLSGIPQRGLETFMRLCLTKYERSRVQPGHAVGAVGAQSIGEPGTQMTLKTFHFAGVAGMNLTQGVPRIKEIINASKVISTPVISCEMDNPTSEIGTRTVKARIEKTYLKDIIRYVDEVWHGDYCYLQMRVDHDTIQRLGLEVSLDTIAKSIEKSKTLKLTQGSSVFFVRDLIRVSLGDPENPDTKLKRRAATSRREEKENLDYFVRVQRLIRLLPEIQIAGYADTHRAIIKKSDKPVNDPVTGEELYDHQLLVEGYGLKNVMTTPGVNGSKTTTNSVMEAKEVLGIEAARTTIINEIRAVMDRMDIDPRHMQLLADVMTFKGDILGITRFGLAKMRDSVLQLASFEKTPDHLFDAAWRNKKDKVEGVSECIIMGQTTKIGTGAFKVVRALNDLTDTEVRRRPCTFETAMKGIKKQVIAVV